MGLTLSWVKTPLAVLLAIVITQPAVADRTYSWKRAHDISDVTITVKVASSDDDMRRLRAQFGNVPVDNVIRTELKGFAVLWRSKDDGLYRCTIYVAKGDDTQTIEHETRHCHGWVHR